MLLRWLLAASLLSLAACAANTPDDSAGALATTSTTGDATPADDPAGSQTTQRPEGTEGLVTQVDDGDSLVALG